MPSEEVGSNDFPPSTLPMHQRQPSGREPIVPNGRSGRRADATLPRFASGRAMTMGKLHRPEAVMSGWVLRPAIPYGQPGGHPCSPDEPGLELQLEYLTYFLY